VILKVRVNKFWDDSIIMCKNIDELNSIKDEVKGIKVLKDGKFKCHRCGNIADGIEWDRTTLKVRGNFRYTSILEVREDELRYYDFYCPHCNLNQFNRSIEVVEKGHSFNIDTLQLK
jgi:predicted RNA-binding Zn-ribbon protein involved in translation (DUF1610 family)